MMVKMLLYEDSPELRDSLTALIALTEQMELAGAFEHPGDILKHVDQHLPDLILMDIDMPVVNGIEGLKMLRSVYDELPVIMLTVFDDNRHILEAIQEGATGYLLKQHIAGQLSSAVAEALAGGAPMSPAVARLVMAHISAKNKKKISYALTNREKEILQSLCNGNSYKMIADKAGITLGTVTTHIKNIYEKLGVHSQAEAVGKALRESLV